MDKRTEQAEALSALTALMNATLNDLTDAAVGYVRQIASDPKLLNMVPVVGAQLVQQLIGDPDDDSGFQEMLAERSAEGNGEDDRIALAVMRTVWGGGVGFAEAIQTVRTNRSEVAAVRSVAGIAVDVLIGEAALRGESPQNLLRELGLFAAQHEES